MVAKKKTFKKVKKTPKLLSGGNPQIPKADGHEPVQAYVTAMPGWKRAVGQQLDELIERVVSDVRKAERWNTPFYGLEGEGWFLSYHCFESYVKVAFHKGRSLRPPPISSKHEEVRYLHIHQDEKLYEEQLEGWVRQASKIPGEDLF